MNLLKYIFILFLFTCEAYNSFCQGINENFHVDNKEIKTIKKANQTKLTFHSENTQYINISSTIWKESKEEKKRVIKFIFPKLYEFANHNTSFESTFVLDSYRNKRRTKNALIKSNSNGIKNPKVLSLALQNEYSDYNSKILKITGGRYYNPVHYPNKYVFKRSIVEGENKNITIYSFEPKRRNKYLLSGYFHTNSMTKNINYFTASPSNHKKNITSTLIFEIDTLKNLSIPTYSKVETQFTNPKRKTNGLKILSETKYSNTSVTKHSIRNSNIVLDLDSEKNIENKDSSSLDTFGNTFNVNSTLDYFEALRLGRLGVWKFDLLLKHLISYNDVEGFRFGAGIATNSKFSKLYDVGGYFAGGSRDNEMKYGGFSNVYIHKKTNTSFSSNYINDLLEPGQVHFPFSNRIFLNEGFRKYAISKMDRVSRLETKFKTTIWKNIFTEFGFLNRYHKTIYDYSFNSINNTFNTNEVSTGIRYNPKEKFFKMNDRLYSLGSKFPSIFINYSKSIKLGDYKHFEYHKIDIKVEKNIHLMQYGVVDFQLIGGYINNNALPYPFAYNMQGSFRPGTPIIHNTFGTMQYNEFIATQYIALFYLHNLGKISHQKNFQPELLVLNNLGFGNNLDLIQHSGVSLNTMEKGFFESGLYLKNLFSFQNIIGKTGFGTGLLLRYGPYQYAKTGDNIVFKFSLDIDI